MGRQYDWHVSEAPKIAQLTEVESHAGDVFVAGKRGVLLERRARGDWQGLTLEGPTGNGHNLNSVAVTDDGERVWYCGDSGSFGYYDRSSERTEPHPGPKNHTDGFVGITVSGAAGEETVHTVATSGRVLRARVDGNTVTVEATQVLGDGTTHTEIVADGGDLFVSDVSGNLHHSRGDGTWVQKRLTKDTVKGLAVADTGVAAVSATGTAYRDISLFEGEGGTKKADLGDVSPEDVSAAGEEFVVVGGDGAVVPIDSRGFPSDVDPGPGVTFYAAEAMANGTLFAVGSSGTILEGLPVE